MLYAMLYFIRYMLCYVISYLLYVMACPVRCVMLCLCYMLCLTHPDASRSHARFDCFDLQTIRSINDARTLLGQRCWRLVPPCRKVIFGVVYGVGKFRGAALTQALRFILATKTTKQIILACEDSQPIGRCLCGWSLYHKY